MKSQERIKYLQKNRELWQHIDPWDNTLQTRNNMVLLAKVMIKNGVYSPNANPHDCMVRKSLRRVIELDEIQTSEIVRFVQFRVLY